ncbi:tRNA (adenosine(37)-N6)-threonylcarbamoyltransferase complex ATPase subunit type 1 TsaE [Pectinatus frisingensis]|jgi:tRNA threonylcarbamoyladenosine biosynthesis protein TsaE|uniref:tRNA (adenosine(37)-N6)-threonylcarbamoyltransferase complex ATPase subunit type 1 TsaE n=1 Tax=Pectinatus frisingensis TaxID=865 RepID=UPI0015F392DF|nr:tRNA (adenosine(37)-N6)-threonylcarbamoyltransferase complex ATPase subunit type 1 TsaE [Pectinatus frisingensis]
MDEKEFTIYTDTPAQTKQLGAFLGKTGRTGVVICLQGGLGAGKTTLTQGLVEFLHAGGALSPTFNLMNVYKGDVTIYHFDLYRLESEEELYEMGFYEYAQEDGDVIVIEWPDKFWRAVPEDNLQLYLQPAENGRRMIQIKLNGEKYSRIYEELKKICQSWQ